MSILKPSPERQTRKAARKAANRERMEGHRQLELESAARGDIMRLRQKIQNGYPFNYSPPYGISINDDGTVTVGDVRFKDSVTMPYAGARAELENLGVSGSNRTANTVAFGVVGYALSKNAKRLLFLKVANGGIEAAIPVDGSNLPHLRGWVASFNTAAATTSAGRVAGS